MNSSNEDWTYVDIASFMLIAEAVTGISAAALATPHAIARAESALAAPATGFGEYEKYPSLEEKAAAIEELAAGTMTEDQMMVFVRSRVTLAS